MSEDTIKKIQDIANECNMEFQITDEYYEDATVKVYCFGWSTRFLDLSECLKYVEYFVEKWRVETELTKMTKTAIKYEEKTRELEEDNQTYKLNNDSQNKLILIKAKEFEEYKELSRQEVARLMVCIANDKKTIRSLRSKLGHANRKITKMRGY